MERGFHQLVEELDRSVFELLRYARANSLDEEINAIRHSLIRFVDWMKTTAKDSDTTVEELEARIAQALQMLPRLASLEERVDALEKKFASWNVSNDDTLNQHGVRITALEGNVTDLQNVKRPGPAPAPKPVAAPVRPMAPRAAPVQYESFELVGADSSNKRIVVELLDRYFVEQNGRLILGSSPRHSHLCINDPSAESKHVSLSYRDRRLFVQDLGSTAGTKINGEPIRAFVDVPIEIGGTITLGKLTLKVRAPTRKTGSDETRVGYTRLYRR